MPIVQGRPLRVRMPAVQYQCRLHSKRMLFLQKERAILRRMGHLSGKTLLSTALCGALPLNVSHGIDPIVTYIPLGTVSATAGCAGSS